MLPWKTIIHFDKKSATPVYLQLVNAFIREITMGRLKPGQRLPGSRGLADQLNLNRKTVVLSYEELMAQGWIEIMASKGTFVTRSLPIARYQKLHSDQIRCPLHVPPSTGFNIMASEGAGQKTILPILPTGYVEINDGSPDERLAPIDNLFMRCRSIAGSRIGRKLLQYSDLQGESTLRKVLADYLGLTRGLSCHENQVFISRGSQMAIYLILNVLLKPNDQVIVGDTNYPAADLVIAQTGAHIIRAPVDEHGISVDYMENICQKKKVRAIYITPHHHFPTTVTLSAERRLKLLHLAEQHKIAILEDDYDYDFHYASSPILPLASIDTKGLVIYTGSFSKLLAPSIRVGYAVAPQNLIREMNKLRRIIDRQGNPVMERAVAYMLAEGEIQRHLKKAVRQYRERRDLFCASLNYHLKGIVNFKAPDGGMAVWTEFSHEIHLLSLQERLLKEGLYLNVDKRFMARLNAARLGFASLNEQEINHHVQLVAKTIGHTKND